MHLGRANAACRHATEDAAGHEFDHDRDDPVRLPLPWCLTLSIDLLCWLCLGHDENRGLRRAQLRAGTRRWRVLNVLGPRDGVAGINIGKRHLNCLKSFGFETGRVGSKMSTSEASSLGFVFLWAASDFRPLRILNRPPSYLKRTSSDLSMHGS